MYITHNDGGMKESSVSISSTVFSSHVLELMGNEICIARRAGYVLHKFLHETVECVSFVDVEFIPAHQTM